MPGAITNLVTSKKIAPNGKSLKMQRDESRRTDNNGLSESQTFEFSRNPKGPIDEAKLTKHGWKCDGRSVTLGFRSAYQDPHK